MLPKIKTTKEDLVEAAFAVARREGLFAITAQSVSKELKTSVAPIFRVFETVEDLRTEVVSYIYKYHIEYLQNYMSDRSEFMTYGLAYVNFAKKEPQLFNILMQEGFFTSGKVGEIVSEKFNFVIQSVAEVGKVDVKTAGKLFYHVWVYTHGLASIASKGGLELKEEEIIELLSTAFQSFLKYCSE